LDELDELTVGVRFGTCCLLRLVLGSVCEYDSSESGRDCVVSDGGMEMMELLHWLLFELVGWGWLLLLVGVTCMVMLEGTWFSLNRNDSALLNVSLALESCDAEASSTCGIVWGSV
jgi:hypothetical protein